ncbi:hypothetical protein OG394_18350 [Kribbella sp. NBC_01245]|uniref:hypothetical protein n=1 Tax=Kribbella sp. NBC_01245 TaxID=2903578 RepID=UPI002E2D3D14|nr:hypothetical protein [Kribbella sp. NBC_01245]
MNELSYVDGIRLIRHPGEQTHTDLTLTFGVGARDETLRTVGVAHLLEHLVMGQARRTPIEIQAMVDLTTTNFAASGSPDRVAAFAEAICAGLTAPPVDRLSVEVGVLAAEDGWSAAPLVASMLNTRYGARGPGLAWLEGAGFDRLTASHVIDFARTWFTKANALLQITGPMPSGLKFDLPDGPAPVRSIAPGRLLDGPSAVPGDIPGAAVMLRLPVGDGARVPSRVAEVLRDRIEEECRHIGGHSYEVDADSVSAGDGFIEWVVYAEAREGSSRAVAACVAAAVRDLAANGPTEAEMARVMERLDEDLSGPDAVLGPVYAAAMREILGEPAAVPLDPELARAVSAREIAAVLTEALPTVVCCGYDEGFEELVAAGFQPALPCPVLSAVPSGEVFKPIMAARVFARELRNTKLVLTEDGLVMSDEDGIHEVRWDDVVGVMRTADATVVFGGSGCSIPLVDGLFKGGARVLEELRRRVSDDLWYAESALGSDSAH